MKNSVFSVVFASAMLGATTLAFAGAYGEAEQPEEIPAPAPAAPAPEPAPPRVMHEFNGFQTDAETTRGLRAEVLSMYAAEYHSAAVGDADAVSTYLRLAYGTELFEVGAQLPYFYAHQENIGSRDGLGDMQLWGKVMPLRTEHVDFGGGLRISFPTDTNLMDAHEYGFLPFLALNVAAGPADIRLSGGYNVSTSPGGRLADDTYDYSDLDLAVLMPVADNVVVRGELVHNHLMVNDGDPLSFYPGVDVTIPVSSTLDLVLRPTLGVGITPEAPDWQLGMGIALDVGGI